MPKIDLRAPERGRGMETPAKTDCRPRKGLEAGRFPQCDTDLLTRSKVKTEKMHTLVLMRHGQSEWQVEGRFAGWTDTALTERGINEAHQAGGALAANGLAFDLCHTSLLKRASATLQIVLETMELTSIPVYLTWHLNERHYGSLQGRYRNEVIAEYGKKQVFRWRRVYDVRPPALEDGDPRLPASDPLYAGLDPARLPRTESHKDTVARVIPYWREAIAPQIRDGKRVLVASHTSSIRGLVKYIEQLSDEQIATFKIETARPLVYKLDGELRPVDRFYLNTGWPSRVRLLASRLKPNSAMPAFDGRLRRNR